MADSILLLGWTDAIEEYHRGFVSDNRTYSHYFYIYAKHTVDWIIG